MSERVDGRTKEGAYPVGVVGVGVDVGGDGVGVGAHAVCPRIDDRRQDG